MPKYGSDPFAEWIGAQAEIEAARWIREELSALEISDCDVVPQWSLTDHLKYRQRVEANKREGDLLVYFSAGEKAIKIRAEVKGTAEVKMEKSVTFPDSDEIDVSEADILIAVGFGITRDQFLAGVREAPVLFRWATTMKKARAAKVWATCCWSVAKQPGFDLPELLEKCL